jgi:hypothetical protein
MPLQPPNIVLAVDPGQTTIPVRSLLRGTRFGPITVGTQGHWVIEAPGVEEVHLVLWFDGTLLWVAAQANCGVLVDGDSVGLDFRLVAIPSDICFGDARIRVGPEHDAPPAKVWPEPSGRQSIQTQGARDTRSVRDSDKPSTVPEPRRNTSTSSAG